MSYPITFHQIHMVDGGPWILTFNEPGQTKKAVLSETGIVGCIEWNEAKVAEYNNDHRVKGSKYEWVRQ